MINKPTLTVTGRVHAFLLIYGIYMHAYNYEQFFIAIKFHDILRACLHSVIKIHCKIKRIKIRKARKICLRIYFSYQVDIINIPCDKTDAIWHRATMRMRLHLQEEYRLLEEENGLDPPLFFPFLFLLLEDFALVLLLVSVTLAVPSVVSIMDDVAVWFTRILLLAALSFPSSPQLEAGFWVASVYEVRVVDVGDDKDAEVEGCWTFRWSIWVWWHR